MKDCFDNSPGSDRLPPFDQQAEAALLGSILLNNNVINDCIAGNLKPDWFYDVRHQEIFEAMLELYDHRKTIDTVTLASVPHGTLLSAYLCDLPENCPAWQSFQDYLDTVRQKYVLRQVLSICTRIGNRSYEVNGDFNEFQEQSQKQFSAAFENTTANRELPTIKALVRRSIDRMDHRNSNRGQLGGIATGFPDLDKLSDGMHPGEMIVLAARPSVGKTSLMANIADHVAVNLGLAVAVFSLEMNADLLTDRMLCARARVNYYHVRDGLLTERDMQRLTISSAKVAQAPIFIDDSAGMSIMQLRAKAIRLKQQHDIKLFCIDYLQLLNGSRKENRQQEVSDISSGIKNLAKELEVPVLTLSQLNRLLEREKARRPKMSDLRESGSLEQDADAVWMLYRSGEEDDGGRLAIPVNLLIAKARNGPSNEDVPFTFLKSYTKFESAAKVLDDEPRLPYVT